MSTADPPTSSGTSFGIFLIATAIVFLGMSTRIERLQLSDENDPGPAAFPVILSVILLAGGAAQLGRRGWQSRVEPELQETVLREPELGEPELGEPELGEPELQDSAPPDGAGSGTLNTLLLGVALAVHIALVPWLGFYLPTAVFSGLMAWRLGARWYSAIITAVLLILVIRVLFVWLFRVQLPQGIFGALV